MYEVKLLGLFNSNQSGQVIDQYYLQAKDVKNPPTE